MAGGLFFIVYHTQQQPEKLATGVVPDLQETPLQLLTQQHPVSVASANDPDKQDTPVQFGIAVLPSQ